MKKKYFFFIMFFNFLLNINAQSRINLNEYGIYLVQNGFIKKINISPIELDFTYFGFTAFWGNYLIINDTGLGGAIIYNIETGAISNPIRRDQRGGLIRYLENQNNLIAYITLHDRGGWWKYEYNYNTLELINEIELYERPFPNLQRSSFLSDFNDGNIYNQRTTEERINDRVYRYRGSNFYLDIHYGHNIDLSGAYVPINVIGGRNNMFFVKIQKIPYDLYNR